eukprot:TRINITY_DN65213_c0_g1_i1.p1 TRINITY_DN65213_c0_g1~~TRINITY_DN65213_c0_g1_i1.p1  ORF type:complete len:477 (-),score=69.32 TRINITY_DN65213_c0_g1_i1:91-1521(-)
MENATHEEETLLGAPVRKILSRALTSDMKGKVAMARALTSIMASTSLEPELNLRPILVMGFLYFKKPLDISRLRQVLKERLMEIPRFRSVLQLKAEGKKTKTIFVERNPDSFSMEEMAQNIPSVKNQKDVDAFVSKLYAENMGTNLPAWRAYIFNNMDDGRSCFLLVVDHAIGDGVSLVATLMSVLDDEDTDASVAKAQTAAPRKRVAKPPSCFANIAAKVCGCLDGVFGDQLPGDPPNRLKLKDHRNPGLVKSVSQSEAISLAKIKEVATKLDNCTVNDVLMTILTLTTQAYFEKHEPTTLTQKLRAIFPISLRPAGVDVLDEGYFGNQFSSGKIRFPIHLKDPMQVFRDCKKQIDYVKLSPAPLIASKLTGVVAHTSLLGAKGKMDAVLDIYGKCTAMLSNVMGPASEAKFCGQPLDDLSFYALSPIGLYLGILSYNGKVRLGVVIDQACEPDASKLTGEWVDAFERLYKSVIG